MVADGHNKKILCTAHGRGREHDFKLFKRSGVCFTAETEALGDRGYQGLQKLHANSRTPRKKPPRKQLSAADRQANRALARERIKAEHVIGDLKVFHILADRYRNRRKRFGLRVNLLAGLYNFDRHL